VAIVQEGELITAAAGITNVSTGVEMTLDTVMLIGSIAKVFNATLVMQLVDAGSIELDQPVLRYLPDLRLKDPQALERITVKMLINHTSGIDSDIPVDYGHDEETIEKGIRRLAEREQLFSPGTELSYSNAATVVAGYLVQRLAGRSWYRLVRERIFEPLQLKHAATLPEEALLHRVSVGHFLTPTRDVVRTSTAFLPLSFSPCGTSLMMSARDLITFAVAHLRNGEGADGVRILSERSAQAMQETTVDNAAKRYPTVEGIGLGWMRYRNGVLHHSGGGPGIAASLYAIPETGFAVAVLTNAAHGLALINELLEPWLAEAGGVRPFGLEDVTVPKDPGGMEPGKYIGIYEDILIRYHISQTAAGLALAREPKAAFYDNISTQPTPPERLLPLGDQQFLLDSHSSDDSRLNAALRIVTFRNPDAHGRMQYLETGLHLYPRVRSV
jgi:CubicO group peptidase (beta-lactamase class C family)